MGKIINSEINYNTESALLKIGTTNKKKPKTIYLEIRCYITPVEFQRDYSDTIAKIIDNAQKEFKGILDSNNNFENYFTFFYDIASDRVYHNKASYLSISAYVQASDSFFGDSGRAFKEVADTAKEELIDQLHEVLLSQLEKEHFHCKRTKK